MGKCFQCGGEHQGTFSCMPPEPVRQVLTNEKSVPPNHSKDDYGRMARLIMGEWEWAYEAGAYAVRRRSDKHLAWTFLEQDYAIQLCKNLNAVAPTPEPLPCALTAAKELCDAAISYAGDVGLSQNAWLWDKIHAFEAACCPVKPEGASRDASSKACPCVQYCADSEQETRHPGCKHFPRHPAYDPR